MTEPPAQPREHPSPARDQVRLDVLLIALATGPTAWIVQLSGDFALASVACRPDDSPRVLPPAAGWGGEHLLLLGINVACLALCLAGGGASWLCWRRSHSEKAGEAPTVVEVGEGRTRFMAVCGMIAAGLFAVGIAFDTVMPLFVP